MRSQVSHALHLILEKMLTWCVHPYLRGRLLRLLGAQIGRNTRIYEARFFNLTNGFRNLIVGDDVHIGPGCLIDLTDTVDIRQGAVLSPRVIVLTHADPGEHHHAPLAGIFPPKHQPTTIGKNSWIGAAAVLLCGAEVGELAVVGANSLVVGAVAPATVVGGSPARHLRDLDLGNDRPTRVVEPEGQA